MEYRVEAASKRLYVLYVQIPTRYLPHCFLGTRHTDLAARFLPIILGKLTGSAPRCESDFFFSLFLFFFDFSENFSSSVLIKVVG